MNAWQAGNIRNCPKTLRPSGVYIETVGLENVGKLDFTGAAFSLLRSSQERHLAKGRNLFSASRRCRSKSGSSKLRIASALLLRCFAAATVVVAVEVGVEVVVEVVVGCRLTSDDIAR